MLNRAVKSLVAGITEDSEAESVFKLLPQVLNLAKECVTSGNEEITREALQIVTTMAELV